MSITAMKQALEALNKLTDAAEGFSVSGVYFNEGVWEQECLNAAYDAIKALEEALAKQEQRSDRAIADSEQLGEPVAIVKRGVIVELEFVDIERASKLPNETKLYANPQPAPQGEARGLSQKKPWVGLTDEEVKDIWLDEETTFEALKKVEAKLKEKNT